MKTLPANCWNCIRWGAGYTQADVTQMARLLTGVTFDLDHGYKFDPRIAEPGLIEVFGKRYGGRPVMERHVTEALNDLALAPGNGSTSGGQAGTALRGGRPRPATGGAYAGQLSCIGGRPARAIPGDAGTPGGLGGGLAQDPRADAVGGGQPARNGRDGRPVRALSDRDTRRTCAARCGPWGQHGRPCHPPPVTMTARAAGSRRRPWPRG